METVSSVDLGSEAFAKRLANLLVATRSQRGRSVRAIARASAGDFSKEQLKALEAGTVPLDDDLIERVVELYGCDLGIILPTRLPVAVGAGVISAGGVVTTFVPHNSTSLLEAYLKLVRSMRRQQKAPAVDLRSDDIEVLAGYLSEPGETVVERLAALMGASRSQRTAMAGLFASGAVVIGLVGTAMAGGGGVTSRSAVVHGPLHDAIGLVVFEEDGKGAATGEPLQLGTDEHDDEGPAARSAAAPVQRPSTVADEGGVRVPGAEVPDAPAVPPEEWPSKDLVDDTVVASDVGANDALVPPPAVPVQQRSDEHPDDQGSDDRGSDDESSDDENSDDHNSDHQGSNDQGSNDQGSDNQHSDDRGSGDESSDDHSSEDQGSDDQNSDDRGSDDESSDDENSDDRGSDDEHSGDQGSGDQNADDQGSDDQGSDDRGSDDRGSDDRGSGGERSDEEGSDDQGSDDQNSDDRGSDDQNSDDRGSNEQNSDDQDEDSRNDEHGQQRDEESQRQRDEEAQRQRDHGNDHHGRG